MDFRIEAYKLEQKTEIIELSLRAWEPVFTALKPAVQAFAYDAFFPDGWAVRQAYDVAQILEHEATDVWVATHQAEILGWVGLHLHPIDQMGEVRIMAVDPKYHRQGIGTALLDFSADLMRCEGMKMVMVETGGDPGHAPARAVYESAGFQRWPVARYFREL
ncbi:GNAT family N-acetyltransferase [Devosia sp. A369]